MATADGTTPDHIDPEILGEILASATPTIAYGQLLALYRWSHRNLYADVCSGAIARILPARRLEEVHQLIDFEELAQHRLAAAIEQLAAVFDEPHVTETGPAVDIQIREPHADPAH